MAQTDATKQVQLSKWAHDALERLAWTLVQASAGFLADLNSPFTDPTQSAVFGLGTTAVVTSLKLLIARHVNKPSDAALTPVPPPTSS